MAGEGNARKTTRNVSIQGGAGSPNRKLNSFPLSSNDLDFSNFIPIATDDAKQRSTENSTNDKHMQAIEDLSLLRWRQALGQYQSIISDSMMGQYLSKLECTVCQTASYNFEPFYVLELSIPPGVDEISLAGLLEYSAKPDLLEEFLWDCPKCGKGRQVTKTNYVYKLPCVLAVCFKRFEMVHGTPQKNTCLITTHLSGENLCKFEKGCPHNSVKSYIPYMIIVE